MITDLISADQLRVARKAITLLENISVKNPDLQLRNIIQSIPFKHEGKVYLLIIGMFNVGEDKAEKLSEAFDKELKLTSADLNEADLEILTNSIIPDYKYNHTYKL